ncbi:MAG TPA: PorT family protein [Crocinitomix sp.]|nr:PorT family protein [Crocinitomix sp.]
MKRIVLNIVFVLFSLTTFAQVGKNYPTFDRKKFHFGFALGINTSDFNYRFNLDSSKVDTVVGIDIKRQPGFNLGIVSSWNINQVIHIRFIPSLSFQERLFTYSYKNPDYFKDIENEPRLLFRESRLESTTLDFPLMLKLKTKRIGNFAAYFLSGLQYSLDLATQSKVSPDLSNPIMKMKQHDYSYQFGGGFDFYMEYFKFAIEIKLSNGLRDVNVYDGTFFNGPITDLRTKVWWFSITFEG